MIEGMLCRPGKIVNPITGYCIDAGGHIAQDLAKKGYIADYEVRPYEARRVTRRQREPALRLVEPVACRPGYTRSRKSGRCIKIGGAAYKNLYPGPAGPQVPPIPIPNPKKAMSMSEGKIALPVGSAGVAPLADKMSILGWAQANCTNDRDPISGVPFASAEPIQDLIRLHNRTCVLSGNLNDKVAAEHKAGNVATIPGDPTNHMTLDDFKALRDSIRRRNPGYRIPPRKHQPPPANWKLYVSPDNRSGPEYASVMYVDVTKVIQTPEGTQYPVDSVKLDMGFIPLKMEGALCAPQMVGELLSRLADSNRLLSPVAGGWKPVAGFPFTKKYWTGPDAKKRFGKLCQELTKALMSPL